MSRSSAFRNSSLVSDFSAIILIASRKICVCSFVILFTSVLVSVTALTSFPERCLPRPYGLIVHHFRVLVNRKHKLFS